MASVASAGVMASTIRLSRFHTSIALTIQLPPAAAMAASSATRFESPSARPTAAHALPMVKVARASNRPRAAAVSPSWVTGASHASRLAETWRVMLRCCAH